MHSAEYLQKLVVRADGTVAMVTDISDGWLVLDDDIDDVAQPDETLILALDAPDDVMVDLALTLGVDPLKARKVPDLARRRILQNSYRVCQVIPHPTIEKSHLTILGMNEFGRYRVRIKPETGSSYELWLSQKSIDIFQRKGELPAMSEAKDFKTGDVVSIGDKVVILKDKTADGKGFHYTDPKDGSAGILTDKAQAFPVRKVEQDLILALYESKQVLDGYKNQESAVKSLRAENELLQKQLKQAQDASRSVEVKELKGELAKERVTLQEEKAAHQVAHSALQEATTKLKTVTEQAAKQNLELMRLKKQNGVIAQAEAVVENATRNTVEVEVLVNTSKEQFARLWSQGYSLEFTQLDRLDSIVTVWKRLKQAPASDPTPESTAVAQPADDDDEPIEADVVEVADQGFAPTPAEDTEEETPEAIPLPNGNIKLGKYGTAIRQHGLEKTLEAMDAEVQLAGIQAMQKSLQSQKRDTKRFLPSAKEETS